LLAKGIYRVDPASREMVMTAVSPRLEERIRGPGAQRRGRLRLRLWKLALQQLADETGLIIQVCHYPPGTLKWNKIEHRMFCHITQNWRAAPLASLLIVIALNSNNYSIAPRNQNMER
jgi:hypothetical protein